MQSAGAGTHPKSFKGKKQEWDRTGELGHESGKGFRRAQHDAVERSATDHPEHGEQDAGGDHGFDCRRVGYELLDGGEFGCEHSAFLRSRNYTGAGDGASIVEK